jgi:hypothetical protein
VRVVAGGSLALAGGRCSVGVCSRAGGYARDRQRVPTLPVCDRQRSRAVHARDDHRALASPRLIVVVYTSALLAVAGDHVVGDAPCPWRRVIAGRGSPNDDAWVPGSYCRRLLVVAAGHTAGVSGIGHRWLGSRDGAGLSSSTSWAEPAGMSVVPCSIARAWSCGDCPVGWCRTRALAGSRCPWGAVMCPVVIMVIPVVMAVGLDGGFYHSCARLPVRRDSGITRAGGECGHARRSMTPLAGLHG